MPALSVLADLPWWAWLSVTLPGPALYICRLFVIYRLGSKALDKANPAQLPAIMNAVTARHERTQRGAGSTRSIPPPGGP